MTHPTEDERRLAMRQEWGELGGCAAVALIFLCAWALGAVLVAMGWGR